MTGAAVGERDAQIEELQGRVASAEAAFNTAAASLEEREEGGGVTPPPEHQAAPDAAGEWKPTSRIHA